MAKRRKSATPRKVQPKTRLVHIGRKSFRVYGTIIRDILRLRGTIESCIPVTPFARLVREMMISFGGENMRIQSQALRAFREATEMYSVMLFEDSNRVAAHAGRITVRPTDMKLVVVLRGSTDPAYSLLH